MNGLDEFAGAAVAIFVIICGLLMLLTRLESAQYHAPVSKPPTTPGGQPEDSTATAREVQEDSQ
jgi:hypothetical protein